MRERTTWSREIIASKLRKVAEDPRSMNQDHIQKQPAADAYTIGDGSPSQFAEDVNSGKGGWKADLGSDGNTKRNEIGLPEFRGDTFNNPESSPGVSPSRQASLSVEEVHARAELATRAARIMLPKTASEQAIEDQALLLMDMPTSSLKSTLSRLAQQDEGDDDEDEDEDEGQDKQAQQDEDDEEEEEEGQQAKQAKDLPPEFLKNIQKKKDEAKDKDDKGEKKEARSRRAQQDEDEKKQSQQQEKEQGKEARARKAQQQQEKEDEKAEAEGQDKEAADQDEEKKDQDKEACGEMGKAAAALIKQAAIGLLSVPQTARQAAFKAMLPMLVKSASQGLGQPVAQQQQLSQQQLQSQVQQLVQQAMQQQLADQQQQVAPGQQQQVAQGQEQLPQLAQGQQQLPQLGQDDSQALVDQLFQEPDQGQQFFASDEIQMDSPTMDIGDVSFGPEDAALNTLFASEPEVQRAIQANALRNGTAAPATRTASTRTVGTRPTEGVSQLGGAVSSQPGGSSEEINRLSGMWSTAPDVSGVFSS